MAGNLISSDWIVDKVYVHSGITSTILSSFAYSGNPSGLVYNGTNLISCSDTTDKIYIHDGISSTILSSFASPGGAPSALTYVGGNLISADGDANRIYIHSGITSTISSSFAAPSSSPVGIVYDGTNLISARSAASDIIYIHDGISSTILSSFACPGIAPMGLTYDGTNLISCDWASGLIYIHSGITSTILESFAAPDGYPDGLAFAAIPVVTTEAAAVPVPVANTAYCEFADGNGTIVSGSNITTRGFEIKHEFSGDLYDKIMHSIAGFEGDTEWDFDTGKWVGTLVKTETEEYNHITGEYFTTGAYTLELGAFPAFFYDQLFAGESYTYRAYMVINDVTYYEKDEDGEDVWVAFSLGVYEGESIPPDDISEGDPTVPIIPIAPDILPEIPYPPFPPFPPPPEIPYPPFPKPPPPWYPNLPEVPPWVDPDFPDLPPLPPWILPDLPEWEIPDYPPQSFVGEFYYKKPYAKKDLDELRAKCIIYNKNSVEFALVLRHNINVLKEFFNMMTDYMDKEEFNDFTDLIPPQRLKELYLDPLEVNDFRDMINEFIRNTVDNNMAVNRNFGLIQAGLSDYETGSDDAYFRDISSAMTTVTEDNPNVDTLKRVVDNLNQEVAGNFNIIMKNLKVIRARLL